MAVPEQIPVVNYVADGIVKKFNVPFEYDQQSDLHIYVDGVEPTTDKYFFADNSFSFYIAPTNGQAVKIKRITPKERDTDYNLHTNTVRPKALNTDFDRLWYVLQEVFSDVGGLSQAVQDEIIARIQGDEGLLNQLTSEISARMLGDEAVTEDLKNYVDQVIGAIINDPTFDGIDANKVNDASGETQQQVNYNGGSKWHSRVGGYKLNERVVLTNGDIVKSTINVNTNDPNVNMTGWRFDDNTVESIAELLAIQNPKNGSRVFAGGFQGDNFTYDSSRSSVNNGHSVFNGWERTVPYLHVSPLQWGADPTGATDSTVAFQAWASHLSALTLSATYPAVAMIPAGTYTINGQIVLANIGNCTIYSLGALISGISANPLDALFKINNAVNTKITGSLTISCNNLENYGSAFKVTASSGGIIDPSGIVSHCDFFGITVERAKVGYQLGEDLDNWDKHVAELHFVGCESRFVQIALANYGSQTEASFDGSTLAVGYLNASHTDREYRIMKVKGGIIEYTGGSLINSMIPSNWTNSTALDITPCKSTTYGNPYPVVSIVNPHIEITGKLLTVSSFLDSADSSFSNINFSGCKGWVGLVAAEDLINVYDPSYSGKISIDETNNFYTSLGVRTGKNINCASVDTILEVKPSAFGKNFVQGFAGIVGGILKHPLKLISRTSGLNASLATGKQPLIFTTANNSGDLSRYSIYYTINGNIQFPHKMKSINIKVNIVDSGINVVGDIFIEKNGSIVCYAHKSTVFATLDYTDNNVLSTDVYRVYFNKPDAVTLNSASVSNISIFAET